MLSEPDEEFEKVLFKMELSGMLLRFSPLHGQLAGRAMNIIKERANKLANIDFT